MNVFEARSSNPAVREHVEREFNLLLNRELEAFTEHPVHGYVYAASVDNSRPLKKPHRAVMILRFRIPYRIPDTHGFDQFECDIEWSHHNRALMARLELAEKERITCYREEAKRIALEIATDLGGLAGKCVLFDECLYFATWSSVSLPRDEWFEALGLTSSVYEQFIAHSTEQFDAARYSAPSHLKYDELRRLLGDISDR